MGNLPTRKGPPIGRASERQMMSETDLGGFRKRYRTNPDGSVTMLKTRAGWPQFITEQNTATGRPVGGWVFQATTSTAEVWDDDSYLSKTTPLALSGNDKGFVGNTNWFSATNPAQTLSFPFVQTEFGGGRRLWNYMPAETGGVWENGEKILDLTTFDHPDYEAYQTHVSVVCAGAAAGVPQAVLKVRYYPTTTSDFLLVRKTDVSTFAGLVGWENVASASVPWGEPIFYQQPTMNASGTAFSAVVLNLVDSTNPSKSEWRYQLLVRTWALPSFSVTDSHSATRRDFFVESGTFNPGIDTYETLPGGVSYLKERKATESYFDERVVQEYETDVPQFAGYNGDQLIVTRRIERFKDVSYYNPLLYTEGKFSDEWVVKSFPLGTTYEDNLAIMQGLVFDGGHTLSPSAAKSHALAATFGSSTPPVIADVMGNTQFGVNSSYTYYYWREGQGGVSYYPHAKFNPAIPLATQLANSFRRTKFRRGFAEDSSKTFLYKSDHEIFGNEAGGVVRLIFARFDMRPSLGAVSYTVDHPLGSPHPSITVTVTRLATSFVELDHLTEVLEASPEVADTDDHGELIHCDPRATLYVRWDDGVIAEFQVPSTGIGDIGELVNLGAASAIKNTTMVARSEHPSERVGAVTVHPGKLRAAILTIDNPDYSQFPGGTPVETSLRHAAGGSVTTVTPPDGKVFVTAVYFRK